MRPTALAVPPLGPRRGPQPGPYELTVGTSRCGVTRQEKPQVTDLYEPLPRQWLTQKHSYRQPHRLIWESWSDGGVGEEDGVQ